MEQPGNLPLRVLRLQRFLLVDQRQRIYSHSFKLEKYYEDFTWQELVQIIDFLSKAEGKESEQNFALTLLEKNFNSNPSDLIYWPDSWFQDPEMLHVDLSSEEIAGYLMARSGRLLADAPEIGLKYPIPITDDE